MNPKKLSSVVAPHSLEAERGVLGSLLIDKDAMIRIADLVKADDFYDPRHSKVFAAMSELFSSHSPIDLLTLSQKLKDKKILKDIGGRGYLAELTEETPTASHILEYAKIVKEKSTLRKLLTSGREISGLALAEDGETNSLLEKAEQSLFKVTQNLIKDKFISIREVLQSRFDEFAELHDAEDKDVIRGIATDFRGLDNLLSGLKPADLVIIAARPSMGKTALALNISQNVALRGGKRVGFLSLEMSKEQLVDRMFASLLGVDSWRLHKGKLTDEEFARIGGVMDELSKANFFIDDSVGSSVMEVRAKARRLQMENGLDLLIVDYLQLMSCESNAWAGNRVQEIGEISRSLKSLARELKIPIIALSQLSRAVENRPGKIPQLADLRESGAIEQDADIVMMMYREDYYEEDSNRPGMTDIFIRKNRNGPTGRAELMFKKEQMRFFDIEKKKTGSAPAAAPEFETTAMLDDF
ncbi:MAG: replicative DNA helicase [Candidatus Peribacteraceae bacterium]|nr:replicative DNA helicase [Candidatus Peribacteraceae bacterium]